MSRIEELLSSLKKYSATIIGGLQEAKNRSKHTGVQPISSIVGLADELAVKGNIYSLLTAQQIPPGISTKVLLNDDYYNTGLWLNTANNRVIVTEPGIYMIFVTINFVLNFTQGGAKNNVHAYTASMMRNGSSSKSVVFITYISRKAVFNLIMYHQKKIQRG